MKKLAGSDNLHGPVEICIPLHVTGEYGLNKIYAGVHWSKRKKQAEEIHNLVRYELQRQKIPRRMFQKPVELIFKYNSRLDLSNHSYLAKLIEDALRGYLIADDSRKYVRRFVQEFWDGEGVLVEIREAK